MFFAVVLTLPFLADMPAASHVVLVWLRFGAGATLLSGILLWVVLKPDHPRWLYFSSALFLASHASRLCSHRLPPRSAGSPG